VKSVSEVEVPQPRPMAELTGNLADLLDETHHCEHLGSWVKINVTDSIRPEKMHGRLRERFEHVVVSFHRPGHREADPRFSVARENADPMDVLVAFLAAAQDAAPAPEQVEAVRTAFEALQREEVSA